MSLGRSSESAEPLRVLHVIHRLFLAGTELGVIKVVNNLDRPRFRPYVVALDRTGPEARAAIRSDVTVFEMNRQEGLDLALIGRLAALMREHRIDLVHSHNWTTYLYAVAASRIARIPIVIHGEHGRETADVSREWRRRILERILARGVHHFTAVSRDLCEHIVRDWGVSPARVRFIPNGVAVERFDEAFDRTAVRVALGAASGERIVGAIGVLRAVKDYDTLVHAFALVRRTRPDTRLVLVGHDRDHRFERRMRETFPEWASVAPHVSFLGIRTDVPALLSEFDVYVNSSIYEGMSNTTLEAMAARRAVVATRVGGTPDLIEEGVNGWLVPSRDPEALADRIGWVLDHPEEARAMGLAGRRRIESHHSFTRMVQGNADLYEFLADRKRGGWRRTHRVRAAVAEAAWWSGVIPFARLVRRRDLTVIAYHRVLPYKASQGQPGDAMRLSAELFEEQIATLARDCEPLTPAEILDRFERRRPFPLHAVWITFDDGYRDNLLHAWPVLRKYGVPATLFLATGPIDDGSMLWWDDLAESVRRLHAAGRPHLEAAARGLTGSVAECLLGGATGSASHAQAVDAAIRALNEGNEEDRGAAVQALHEAARMVDDAAWPRLMLTWEEIRRLCAEGLSLGGHTHRHTFLDTLSAESASEEIHQSLQRIADETGQRPSLFAYPRGRSDANSRRILLEEGVRLAVTTVPGRNTLRTDPLALYRRDSGQLSLGHRHSRAALHLELTGWLDGRYR
jgi:sugar transferase (PEP-CTERM/EpsH1 system associated)